MGRAIATIFVLILFAGCASPRSLPPQVDAALSRAEETRLLSLAAETALARRARVYDLAWPVLKSNVELCPDTAPKLGLVLADRDGLAEMAGGIEKDAFARLGIAEGVRVVHASAGSPSGKAGIPDGAMVSLVEGEPVEKPGEAAKALKKALEEDGTASLTAEGVTYTMTGEMACDVAVKISTSQALNAHAASGITINTGLIRALDDEALRYVIAHELAHVAMGHKEDYIRNGIVTGGPVTGPVAYALASTGDRLLRLFGKSPDRSLTGRALKALAPWTEEYEIEADYVGLYMHARAGGDIDAAREAYDVMGRESPKSLTVRATHPLVPDRLAMHEAVKAELERKLASGEPWLPEMRE